MWNNLTVVASKFGLDSRSVDQFAVANMRKYGVKRDGVNVVDSFLDRDQLPLVIHSENIDHFVSGFRRHIARLN